MSTKNPRLPDAALHRSEPDYLRELLAAAKLSQRSAARVVGVDERTMRYYASGDSPMPYPVQFCLETLAANAGGRVADAAAPTAWLKESDRRLTPDDVGKIVVGRGPGGYVVGRVKRDEWGVVIEPLPGRNGVDGGDVPAGAVTDYVLVDMPAS